MLIPDALPRGVRYGRWGALWCSAYPYGGTRSQKRSNSRKALHELHKYRDLPDIRRSLIFLKYP